MSRTRYLALLALTVAAPAAACDLHLSSGWIRDAPPGANVRAGYVQIENRGERDRVITGAESEAFGAMEIHTMIDVDGMARMRRVRQLEVPAGQSVSLQPGGLHLMLFRPQSALALGDEVTITLQVDDACRVQGRFVVAAEAP